MLQWLLGLFRSSAPKARQNPQSGQTEPVEDEPPPPYLHHESMLDTRQQVAAYALRVAKPDALHEHAWQASSLRFFDNALIDFFAAGKLDKLLGKRLAFLPLSAPGLENPKLDQLPRERLVIEFDPPPGAEFDPIAVRQRMQALHADGFMLCCADSLMERGLSEAMELASFISLADVATRSPPDLLARCHLLRTLYPKSKLMARNIDSTELYQACRQMGFQYFQGRFLTDRGNRRASQVATYRMVVLDLLNAIKRQAEFDELAGIAWRDPALAYRLLRFANSAAMGLREKAEHLRNAMIYLGRDELYRWLTLLLFSSRKPDHLDFALRENALVRAKMAEELAAGTLSRKERDDAFVVGILSVIDVLLEMPMPEALAQLTLPEAISEALLHRRGKYATYLKLAIACEEKDQSAIQQLAAECGMDAMTVNLLQIEALTWVMNISEALDEAHAEA